MTDRRTLANAIRFLSIDAVQAANSGHPEPRWVWQMLLKYCGVGVTA